MDPLIPSSHDAPLTSEPSMPPPPAAPTADDSDSTSSISEIAQREKQKMYLKEISVSWDNQIEEEHVPNLFSGRIVVIARPRPNGPVLGPLLRLDKRTWIFDPESTLGLPVIMTDVQLVALDWQQEMLFEVSFPESYLRDVAENQTTKNISAPFNQNKDLPPHQRISISFSVDCVEPAGTRSQTLEMPKQPPPLTPRGSPNPMLYMHQAAKLPPDAPAKPALFNTAGMLYLEEFNAQSKKQDLDRAVDAFARACNAVWQEHGQYNWCHNNAGNAFHQRYVLTNDMADLDQAILIIEDLVDNNVDAEVNELQRWTRWLGEWHLIRFERFGKIEDINKSVSNFSLSLNLGSERDERFSTRLNHLGTSLVQRFDRLNKLDDLSAAISLFHLAVDVNPGDSVANLTNLSACIAKRFQQTGKLDDIDEAIAISRSAVDTDPSSHSLQMLGSHLSSRYDNSSDVKDINESILLQQRAIQEHPNGHPKMSSWLNTLGVSYGRRARDTLDPADLRESISLQRQALLLTPHDSPMHPLILHNLGLLLSQRFRISHDTADINEAIEVGRAAVESVPEGDERLSLWKSTLALSYDSRYLMFSDPEDIDNAIKVQEEIIESGGMNTSYLPNVTINLSGFYYDRFSQMQLPDDLERAISLQRKAIGITPDNHANQVRRKKHLADSLVTRFRRTKLVDDRDEAIKLYQEASTSRIGPVREKLSAAVRGGNICFENGLSEQGIEAFSIAVKLVARVAGLGQTVQERYLELRMLSHIGVECAAAACSIGETEKALEWLEEGRALVWRQLTNLRTPLDDLRAVNAELADEIENTAIKLERAGQREEYGKGWEKHFQHLLPDEKLSLQSEVTIHVQLADEWDILVEKVRQIDGFAEFLQPKTCSAIMEGLPSEGLIIIINTPREAKKSDALVLMPGADAPIHISLDRLSYDKGKDLCVRLRTFLEKSGIRLREAGQDEEDEKDEVTVEDDEVSRKGMRRVNRPVKDGFADILRELWMLVVQPIFNNLALLHPTDEPGRVWWCVTGPLSFLPIHAAGIYHPQGDEIACSVTDYVVSTYVPTVGTLVERVKRSQKQSEGSTPRLLIVSQPNTPKMAPIPGTIKESKLIKEYVGHTDQQVTALEGSEALVERVVENMATHSWIHLACHASQELADPLRSRFYFQDGSLELFEIIKSSIKGADLAFLSACQTGAGTEAWSEEATHLAAGMLAAGYQGVVATMWSIRDRYGPIMAEDFYKFLSDNSEHEGESTRYLDPNRAAYALHAATRNLRKKLGDNDSALLTWVPYVHYGL